jgi:hypothetical protein
MAQLNFLKFAGRGFTAGSSLTSNRDLDQLGARAGSNVHATRRDELSLVARLSSENSKDGSHIGIVNGLLITLEETRDMAAAQAGFARNVCLLKRVSLREAVQRSAEVAHNFFVRRVPFYGNSALMQ